MDSLTQLVLGASVGDAALGRVVGRRAALWGAVLGTLPDLDILLPIADDVAAFTEHRSWSHSAFVLSALAPVCAIGLARLHAKSSAGFRDWLWLTWLVFITHIALDCCTAYGTQVLWPSTSPPVAWANIFIIDPLYTLPLCLGVGLSVIRRRSAPAAATRWNWIGLTVSLAYLAWTLVAQQVVTERTSRQLERDSIRPDHALFITPTPLNTLLWRIVAIEGDAYYEGFHSLVSDGAEVTFTRHSIERDALPAADEASAVARLEWFTRGVYSVEVENRAVILTDLRMGADGDYPFRFIVGHRRAGQTRVVEPRKLDADISLDRLAFVWRRIWTRDP